MNDTVHGAETLHAAAPVSSPAAAAASGTSVTLGSGIVDVLESLRQSAEPELLAIYQKTAPWYLQAVIAKPVIHDALAYGFAMVEGAAKDAVLAIPTAQKVIEEAVRFADAHMPSFVKPYLGPVEDVIIVDLQKIGALPRDFSRTALRAA